jgi:sulfoacetaldehyde acetyltransferase
LGVAFTKTEVVLVAVFGAVVLGEMPTGAAMVASGIGLAGVPAMARAPAGGLVFSGRAVAMGLATGALFGAAATGYRGAALALEPAPFLLRATVALAAATAMQTVLMAVWLVARKPGEVPRVPGGWRRTAPVGNMGMVGSPGWFTAFPLQAAAYVRAVGQAEQLFTLAASVLVFGERPRPRELAGIVLVGLSVRSWSAPCDLALSGPGRWPYRGAATRPRRAETERRRPMRMTTEEAFVKVLQRHGIDNAFGIIGSAFMPISDLFPKAGITFWDCAHEGSGGMMADGFTRASGRMCMMIAQNGPGITNFVTAVKTAYWNHTPLLLVTPQAANRTIGMGGFQEVEQMALFQDMVAYQEEVRDPARVAEVLNRVILNARRMSAPAQINMPRDFWTREIDIDLPAIVEFERPAGGEAAIRAAADLLSSAKFPVILNGAGVVLGGAIPASMALAERLDAPVCVGYQHNDAFPGSHPLFAGPLGYNGSRAAMELISRADVVFCLGTRLNPFSTLPGYALDYWPKTAKIIQVDINPDRIGLTKPVTVGIVGDSKKVAEAVLARLASTAGSHARSERKAIIAQTKSAWAQALASMDHEEDDPGTSWNHRARAAKPDWMSPRMAWRAIQSALPREAIISSDIGNNCAIGNAYPTFDSPRKYLAPGLFGPCGYGLPSIVGAKIACPDVPVVGFAGDGAFGIAVTELTAIGRPEWPAITMVVFRNYQWGAEKRNSTLWYDDNFVGTELDQQVSYAGIARACGLQGVVARTMDELSSALRQAVTDQMEHGKTTLIEALINQELGEPFRRDAMKKPVVVAGIDPADMARQAV